MSKSFKPTPTSKHPHADAEADGAPSPVDDSVFLAPEDLVGEDLAAQLQNVLDSARAQIETVAGDVPMVDSSFDAAATVKPVEKEKESAEDDATFESPDEVFAVAESETPVAEDQSNEGECQEMNEQIQQLLNLTASESEITPAPQGKAAASSAASEIGVHDDSFVDPKELVDDLEELAQMIEKVNAPSSSPKVIEDSALSVSTMKQLDEFLADQADHAVADEFDTVEDVVQGSMSEESFASPAQVETDADEISDAEDEFDSPEKLLMGDGQPFDGGADASGTLTDEQAQSSSGGAGVAASGVVDADGEIQSASESEARAKGSKASLRVKLGRILLKTKGATYQVCAMLNRPLRNASAGTRRNVGMIGLITLANASLLLLGKWLHFWD